MSIKLGSILIKSVYTGNNRKVSFNDTEMTFFPGQLHFLKTYSPLIFIELGFKKEKMDYSLKQFYDHDFSERPFPFNSFLTYKKEGAENKINALVGKNQIREIFMSSNLEKIFLGIDKELKNYNNQIIRRTKLDDEFEGYDSFISHQKRFKNSLKISNNFLTDYDVVGKSISSFLNTQFDHLNNDEFKEYAFFNRIIKEKTIHRNVINDMMHHLRINRFNISPVAKEFEKLYVARFKAVLSGDSLFDKMYQKQIEDLFR